jgi:membrane protein implicated in regulation of membrane protease activity
MNHRGARMVGQTARVVEPIRHGTGRVHIGDGQWNARGVDAGVGDWVRIVGNDGSTLLVEPIPAPGADTAG